MKLSLVAVSIASLSALSVACGNDDDGKLRRPPAPADLATAQPPPAAPPPRTMVTGNALPTSPVNLIADPGFGLVGAGQQAGFGSFLAFDDSFTQLTLTTTVESRSPAGFGGAVAHVLADGATDRASTPIMVLTSFQGGAGPFHAKVWVSRSTVAGAPATLTIGAKGMRASITDETPDGEAFDLTPVESATRVSGGRTWTLLRAEITKGLGYGGFFVVHTGTGGGQFLIAAPEIVAQPLVDGLVSTHSTPAFVRTRSKTDAERTAILRYRSQRQQLVPAR
ncbi:MAG: hypothetical protein JWP87_5108 [Labilithrix sp.]|nr:hypothetical protein [Labilithrix sp.]